MGTYQKPTIGKVRRGPHKTDKFVGREEQVKMFSQNLALRLDDPRRRFVFAVSGDGGWGRRG